MTLAERNVHPAVLETNPQPLALKAGFSMYNPVYNLQREASSENGSENESSFGALKCPVEEPILLS